jgi:hypothetical protein
MLAVVVGVEVENERRVEDEEDTAVEPPPYTRVVRDIRPHRIDQMLVHSTHNTKIPVTASAFTKRVPTGRIYLYIYIEVYIYISTHLHHKYLNSPGIMKRFIRSLNGCGGSLPG